MHYRFLVCLAFIVMLVASCQGGPPPITYVMEVTKEVTKVVTVVVTADGSGNTGPLPVGTASATGTVTQTPAASTATPVPTMSPTSDVFPTPVVGQIYVAEQNFEEGRMFWLQPVKQIWVATTDENGKNIWSVYEDTFVDGQPEIDPKLTPPSGRLQPERGFGKVWRENADVKQQIGWALEPEYGYVTRYEYRAGGSVVNDEYVFGEGRHLVTMLDGQIIVFNRADYTWEILEDD